MKTLTIHCHNGDTWTIQYTNADFPDTLREMWAEQGKLLWYRIREENAS